MSLSLRAIAGFAASLVVASAAHAQVTGRGIEFWACWPRSHLSLETSAELVIMADETTSVSVDGAFTMPPTPVSPGAPLIIPIPSTLRIAASRSIEPEGFRVRSVDVTKPISALFRVPQQAEASDDIARLLPLTELGRDYIVSSYPAALPNEPSYYAVIATENNTRVSVDIPCGGTTDTVMLDQGEVYQVFCQWLDGPPDVTGAHVSANKPVAVLAGSSDAYVPTNWLSGDFVIESMIPVNQWGTEFYVPPLPKGPNADPAAIDLVRIVASAAGSVTVEDAVGPTTTALAAAGDFLDVPITTAVRVTGTVPLSVHLFAAGVEMTDLGDPFMCEIPPVSDYSPAFRIYVPPAYTEGSYLTIVTTTADTAALLLNGAPVTGWSVLPGGTYSWALVDLGFQGPEHLVSSTRPCSVFVHGYNDAYQPNPNLGRVPGSYGYPAPTSVPPCLIFVVPDAPISVCNGLPITLGDGGTSWVSCASLEYRWLRNGVPIPGCSVFGPSPDCSTTFTGQATYTLEARCAADPLCTGRASALVLDDPAPPVRMVPVPARTCAGSPITLDAGNGFVSYLWTSNPPDPGVTPQDSALSSLVATPDVDSVYTVVATDVRGCTTTGALAVTTIPDPIPPPLGNTLRVTKALPADVRFRWTDLTGVPVGNYEVVGMSCPLRDSCGGRHPDPITMQASPVVGGPVPIGTELAYQPGALNGLGGLIFYYVRGTSPCAFRPGPTCNGWPHQIPPCP